jgi:hypothetical protein
MSLEAALIDNTNTMKALIAAMEATAAAQASAQAAPKPRAAPAAAPAPGPSTAKAVEAAAPASTASAQAPAAVSAQAPAAASTAAADPVTYDQVAKAITDGVKKSRDAVMAALGQFGAKKGPELKPEQYADFLKALA